MDRTMYDWLREAADALDLPPEARWVDDREVVRQVLDLARDVAQGVARPAAPLGAFLAGVAVGLDPSGQGGGLDRVRERLAPTLRDE
ncbi:MAG: DUF6457 domain-containing protein [Actinomycetota bacterium]|nr:DUF6457 domain-containing protein [Actinomycetota bacterium]